MLRSMDKYLEITEEIKRRKSEENVPKKWILLKQRNSSAHQRSAFGLGQLIELQLGLRLVSEIPRKLRVLVVSGSYWSKQDHNLYM